MRGLRPDFGPLRSAGASPHASRRGPIAVRCDITEIFIHTRRVLARQRPAGRKALATNA